MKKKINKNFAASLMALLGVMVLTLSTVMPSKALADDIDIYSLPPTNAAAPNLMFLIDSSANWNRNNEDWEALGLYNTCLTTSVATNKVSDCQSLINEVFYPGANASVKRPWQTGYNSLVLKKGLIEIRTLKRVVNQLVCNGAANALRVNIGLSFLGNGTVAGNNTTAIINQAVTALTGNSTDSAATSSCGKINAKLNAMDTAFGGGSPYQTSSNANYGGPLFELFKYFGGYANPTGSLASPVTPGSPASASAYGPIRHSSANNLEDEAAFTSASKATYSPPVNAANQCSRNYVVLISNGPANSEPSGPSSFGGLGYTPPTVAGGSSTYADEWSYFLSNTDVNAAAGAQPLYTYAIDVYNGTPNAGQVTQTALLKSMVKVGGVGPSGYFLANGDLNALTAAFSNILTNAAAVDSVFTATSLPVSTTTQGSFLNQLFVGMFRPDGNARPGWVGNLKQYKLAFDANKGVVVVDANATSAIDLSSGFFKATATSIWTNASKFFTNRPSGTPASISDAPDGAVVDKGGAAQKERRDYQTSLQQLGRKMLTVGKTVTSQAATGFPSPSVTTVGTDDTGTSNVTLSLAEIAWMRGADNVASGNGAEYFAGTSNANGTVDVRPSIHGDILHSRPVALNYGKDANNEDNVVVFYGTNDGLLHAVDGRTGSSTAGSEYWSFLAPESYDVVKRARAGFPEVLLPINTSTGAINVPASGSTAQARRYGMDGPIGVFASYSTAGALSKGVIFTAMRRGGSAVYAFDVTSTPSGANPALLWAARSTMADFSRMGQSWSMPKAVVLNRATYGNTSNVVAVFGAGYNPEEDDPSITITSNKGKALYVVDAFTGTRRLELTGSGANAITGSVVGDVTVVDANLDGQFDRMYFADVRGGVYRVDMAAGFTNWTVKKIAQLSGKIFHAPDVVVTKDFVSVFVGTGDREKPMVTSTSNGFYLIKDTLPSQTERGSVLSQADLKQVSTVSDAGVISAVTNATADTNGCYISLATNGEKVINTPLTVAGTTFFGTNKPLPAAANACTGSLGEARSYRFPLFCGQATSSIVSSGGYPPSPVGGLVNIDGEIVPFVIGGGTGRSAFESERPTPPIEPLRKRNFYRILPSGSGSK